MQRASLLPRPWLAGFVVVGLGAAAACGNSASGVHTSQSTAASSTATTSSTGSGGSSATASTGSSSCNNLPEAANAEWCSSDATKTDCSLLSGSDKEDVCGVPLPAPSQALTRSSDVMEFSGSGPPQLDCFEVGKYPSKPDPSLQKKTVKMQGVAKIFSSGCSSDSLTIEVYTVKREKNGASAADEGDIDQLVGTPTATADKATCMSTGTMVVNDKCNNNGEPRYECPFEYDGVPEETELLVKTYGDNWAPLYDYNIYIPDSEVVNGVWNHDVRALANDDYTTIPTVAYGGLIDVGNGAIAGEVHDCGDVRMSNALVNINAKSTDLTYFTADEQNPLPAKGATSTSQLGLYAALNVAPGPVTVASVGLDGGKVVTTGYFKARVFPDSVSAVTFRGVRPFEVP